MYEITAVKIHSEIFSIAHRRKLPVGDHWSRRNHPERTHSTTKDVPQRTTFPDLPLWGPFGFEIEPLEPTDAQEPIEDTDGRRFRVGRIGPFPVLRGATLAAVGITDSGTRLIKYSFTSSG